MAPTIFSPAGTSNEKLNSEIEGEIHTAIADLTLRLQQLHTLHTPRDDNNQNHEAVKSREAGQVEEGTGVRIITLAGQNYGATMNLPGSAKNLIDEGEGGQRESVISSNHTTINIYINNNVQGVNNSILYNSSCELRDPGVHLNVSTSEIASSPSGISSAEEKVVGSSSRAPAVTTLSKYTTAGRKRSLTEFLNSGVDVEDQASCAESASPRSRDEWHHFTPSPEIDDLCKAGSEEGGSAHSEFRASNYTEFVKASASESDSKSKPRKARFLLIRKLLICSSRNSRVVE